MGFGRYGYNSGYRKWIRRIRARRLFWLHKIKTGFGCAECGYNKSGYALDFAHIEPLTKNPRVYRAVTPESKSGGHGGIMALGIRITKDKPMNRGYIRELFEEIRKCRVLCRNCHAVETHLRGENRNNYKTQALRENPEMIIIDHTQMDMF